jgi:hypothetical protein
MEAGFSDRICSIEEIVGVWDRRVEMTASWFTGDSMAQKNTADVDRAYKLRHLYELIAALDRRVPRVERAGEVAIARDAAALRGRRPSTGLPNLRVRAETIQPVLRPARPRTQE